MEDEVKLLRRSGNYAILHLGDRNFPGIFLQGDTFNGIFHEIIMARELIKSDPKEAFDSLSSAGEKMLAALNMYEDELVKQGRGLPYGKSVRGMKIEWGQEGD